MPLDAQIVNSDDYTFKMDFKFELILFFNTVHFHNESPKESYEQTWSPLLVGPIQSKQVRNECFSFLHTQVSLISNFCVLLVFHFLVLSSILVVLGFKG